MWNTVGVLLLFLSLICRSWFEYKWGISFDSRICFGCKMLVQYGDNASIIAVLLFPEFEGDIN